MRVSIRSPYRSKGRFGSVPSNRALVGFNPLPLPKQGEIFIGLTDTPSVFGFQSAPLTEARGDCSHCGGGQPDPSFNPLPLPKQGEMLVAVTSKVSEGYIGCSAIRSNEYRYILMRLSKYGVTSFYADYCERRESAGNTPALWVRASYKTSGPVKSAGSLMP